MSRIELPYAEGLADLGDGCFAWLEPPGSWGLANSGIVVGDDDVLVVDTQNDMRLGHALRTGVDAVAGGRPVRTVINTHGDSDHWSGNIFYPGARILASAATHHEMTHMWLDQNRLTELARGEGALAGWVGWRTRAFDYRRWHPVHPNETFRGELTVEAAGRQVRLIEVGPAHTTGDVLVFVPASGVLYAGDILFTDSTPMVWTGPVSRCIAACDRILELDPRVVVPGHGPLVDQDGVRRMRDYLDVVLDRTTRAHATGRTPDDAYAQIDLGPFAAWPHASRVYHTIRVIYRDLDPQGFPIDRLQALDQVLTDDDGRWKSEHER